jgi:Uma2 family endonuclease
MATATTFRRPPYLFTVDQYTRLLDAGIVPEGTELLEGIITVKGHYRDGDIVPYRFTADEYERMVPLGVLREGEKAELIDGEVVARMSHGDPHGLAVEQLDRRLQRLLPDDISVRCQLPIRLPDASQPEPDVVICEPANRRGATHPRPEHLFVVIEVADSSLIDDRKDRTVLYSRYGIPEYWIVNLPDRTVEVYTDPKTPRRGVCAYRTRTDYGPGQEVPVVIAGVRIGAIPVNTILPQA